MSRKELYEEIKQSSKDISELYSMMSDAAYKQDAAEVYRLAVLWCNKCRYLDALEVAAKEGEPSV